MSKDQPASPDPLRQAALDYHEFPRPGKLEIRATKPREVFSLIIWRQKEINRIPPAWAV